jgi:hypothetical protein
MLSIMSLAFQGTGSDQLAKQKGDFNEQRKQIFSLYVEQMFLRKGNVSRAFPKEKIIAWLSWLAQKMKEHSQSVFLVEGLQPSWLSKNGERIGYSAVVAFTSAISCGLVAGAVAAKSYGPVLGLTLWLIFMCGIGLGCWSESPLKNSIVTGLVSALAIGIASVDWHYRIDNDALSAALVSCPLKA